MIFYNEFDPKAAAWLKELIKQGQIANGEVNEKSITQLTANDLANISRAHFFAGIGGWDLALQLAGWPDEIPVWTGSCPCQPFSVAGKRKGTKDARNLWPEFFRLITECKPPKIFGEQVASSDGRLWFDTVRTDLETLGYEVGAADLCAAGIGAPHIRQRLYFFARLANTNESGRNGQRTPWVHEDGTPGHNTTRCREVIRLGDTDSQRTRRDTRESFREKEESPLRSVGEALISSGTSIGVGNSIGAGLEGHSRHGDHRNQPRRLEKKPYGPTPTTSFWSDPEWVYCRDGKYRPIEPGTQPLAHGVSGRVGLLRGYGNAINPYVAAKFIQAVMDVL